MPKTLEAISLKTGDFGHFMTLAMVLYEHSVGENRLSKKQLMKFDKEIKELTLDARVAVHDELVEADKEYRVRYGTSDKTFQHSADFFRKRYIEIGVK